MSRIIKLLVLALFLISPIFSQKGVFIGGGLSDNNTEIWNKFISLATPVDASPYIGIITAASDTAADNGKYYADLLQNTYGVQRVKWLPIDVNHTSEASSSANVAEVNKMTGIFFGGGDQSRLITCFYSSNREPTPVLKAIIDRHAANSLVVAGSSAGTTIQQGTPMVTGGESWDALVYGAFPYIQNDYPDNLSYEPKGGFNIFPFGYLDTHFATRGREGRMWKLLWALRKTTPAIGWGIDEDTALVVDGTLATVIGNTGVYFMDLTAAQENSEQGLDGIKISYLTEGDQMDLNTKKIAFANWKENIRGRETNKMPFDPTDHIFDSYLDRDAPGETFTNITTNLINSYGASKTRGFSWQTDPELVVEFNKGATTQGAFGAIAGKQFVSFSDLIARVYQDNSSHPTELNRLQKKFLSKD